MNKLKDIRSEFKKLKEEYDAFSDTIRKLHSDIFKHLEYVAKKLPFKNIEIDDYKTDSNSHRVIPSRLGIVIEVKSKDTFSGYKYFTVYTVLDEQQIYLSKGENIYNEPIGKYNFKSDEWDLYI